MCSPDVCGSILFCICWQPPVPTRYFLRHFPRLWTVIQIPFAFPNAEDIAWKLYFPLQLCFLFVVSPPPPQLPFIFPSIFFFWLWRSRLLFQMKCYKWTLGSSRVCVCVWGIYPKCDFMLDKLQQQQASWVRPENSSGKKVASGPGRSYFHSWGSQIAPLNSFNK